jgi:hypothetical protein
MGHKSFRYMMMMMVIYWAKTNATCKKRDAGFIATEEVCLETCK